MRERERERDTNSSVFSPGQDYSLQQTGFTVQVMQAKSKCLCRAHCREELTQMYVSLHWNKTYRGRKWHHGGGHGWSQAKETVQQKEHWTLKSLPKSAGGQHLTTYSAFAEHQKSLHPSKVCGPCFNTMSTTVHPAGDETGRQEAIDNSTEWHIQSSTDSS